MTRVVTALTAAAESRAAGMALGARISSQLDGPPDAVIVFASAQHDYGALLRAVMQTCEPRLLVGCSSAGEFTSDGQHQGAANAIAFRSDELQFAAAVGRGLRTNRAAAARELVDGFQGLRREDHGLHRYALVLTDALAGHADALVDDLTRLTGGTYRFFGGGAGDDARFQTTHVFMGEEAVADAAVALEILSAKPLGIGVRHGWKPASPPLRATEADGMHLRSLNAAPTMEVLEDHAAATGQSLDPGAPLPFFLQNVLGVETAGGHRLRVPLAVTADGGVNCAADIPAGATVHIMGTTAPSAAAAAADATRDAVSQLGPLRPGAALFFDCVATRLRTGAAFGGELQAVQDVLGPDAVFAGCNTYGQIARSEGQFSGFHNCTAVVCVFPE